MFIRIIIRRIAMTKILKATLFAVLLMVSILSLVQSMMSVILSDDIWRILVFGTAFAVWFFLVYRKKSL